MIRNRNIVCIASSWYAHPTSKHHVMRILSQYNHVVWVNYHASRRPTFSRNDALAIWQRLRRSCAGPRRVDGGINVLSPLVIPLPESAAARWLNVGILARQIRHALRHLPQRPTQLWLFAPDVPGLISRLDAERVVYYCVDDFAAFSGYNARLTEALETRTIAASDVVITTSQELFDTRRRLHANTHLVPHGVDFEHFAAAADWPADRLPADIARIPRPIFGYCGLISDYVDLELIAAAARRRPDWSFVLIGDATCPLEGLAKLPNVHVLGGRPYEALPAYCSCFDVGLIPFHMNRLVRAVNPIKLREYLAAGLPVVSAPMAAVMNYVPAVFPAQTLDEFLAAGSAALQVRRPAERAARQDLMRRESWRCRVEDLSRIVMGIPGKPVAAARPGTPLREPITTG
jgi:glycosyltransferase involved in cell wall biosynthesis